MVTSRALVAALLVCAACHHDKAAKTLPTPEPAATSTAQATPPPAAQPVSNNLSASDNLVRACQLHFANEQEAPKFGFNEADLTTDDRNVLTQIADCITKGPMKGHRLALVGHADPRGTEEYNLGLGDRRAHTVATYLERLGVTASALDTKTRGALDASGTSEPGWSKDRRVDVDLD
jgi:peptidoglycan-associated lipoprotein